ncbi:MAG: hypothetical protein R3B93_19360 [Bacteroidia bacterium]
MDPLTKKVAEKYEANEETINMLAKKVMEGGSGVWGEAVMPANPQVEEADVKEMIRYNLSLDEEKAPTDTLPVRVLLIRKKPNPIIIKGVFIARAVYTDKVRMTCLRRPEEGICPSRSTNFSRKNGF